LFEKHNSLAKKNHISSFIRKKNCGYCLNIFIESKSKRAVYRVESKLLKEKPKTKPNLHTDIEEAKDF
jgi:hypothetical protein